MLIENCRFDGRAREFAGRSAKPPSGVPVIVPWVRRLAVLATSLVILSAAGGCGGGDSAEELRLQEDRIERAKEEAAREARAEERARQQTRKQAREQKRLRRELNRLKRERKSSSSNRGESRATRVGSRSCGGSLSVGPNTSCGFAANVRDAYYSSGGDSVVDAYSPATGRTYTMQCSGGSPHVCTGGNNASVYFP